MKAHYIILKSGVVLRPEQDFAEWRAIQAEYPDFVTSLGPWTEQELLGYLRDDFSSEAEWPISQEVIYGVYNDQSGSAD